MSITFWCPSAPELEETYPCQCADVPDWTCPDGLCKDGVYTSTYSEGEFNVANHSARVLFDLLGTTMFGLSFEYAGEWTQKDFPLLRHAIMAIRNIKRVRQPAITSPSEGGGNGKCHWYDAGYSEDRILRYCDALDRLITIAINNGGPIVWA